MQGASDERRRSKSEDQRDELQQPPELSCPHAISKDIHTQTIENKHVMVWRRYFAAANHSQLRLRRRRTTPTARPTEELPSNQITKQPAYSQTLHSSQANTTTTNKHNNHHNATNNTVDTLLRAVSRQSCKWRRCRATHTHRIDALLRAASRQPQKLATLLKVRFIAGCEDVLGMQTACESCPEYADVPRVASAEGGAKRRRNPAD